MLKKIISLLLSLMLISGFAAFADDNDDTQNTEDTYLDQPVFSGGNMEENLYKSLSFSTDEVFTDISDNTIKHYAEILCGLGFIDGASEHSFEPDKDITRAEFVDSVVRILNSNFPIDRDTVYFVDIPLDSKYFNTVTNAVKLGLVSGYGDGIFAADDAISFNEAVCVLVKAVGRGSLAMAGGGYPSGFVSEAGRCKLTKGATSGGTSLKRGDAAVLLYNFMHTPMLTETSYNADGFEYAVGDTVLCQSHGIYTDEGVVNANFVSSLDDYPLTETDSITVGNTSYKVPKRKYIEYLGYPVEVYYTKDSGGIKNIEYLIKSIDINELIIPADEIHGFENNAYKYGTSKVKTQRISVNHTLIVNGKHKSVYTEADFIPKNGEVILVGLDSSYTTVIINTFTAFAMKNYSTANGVVLFESFYNAPAFSIDLNDDSKAFMVYLDGVKVDFYANEKIVYNADGFEIKQYELPSIPKNSVINFFADEYDEVYGKLLPAENATYVKLAITTKSVNGEVNSVGNEKVEINGNMYKVAKDNILNEADLNFKAGMSATFLFDFDSKVYACVEALEQLELKYGYLIDINLRTAGLSETLQMKILDADGKVSVLDCAEKLKLNKTTYTDLQLAANMLHQSAAMLDSGFTISQLIRYSVGSDGTLREVVTATEPLSGAESDAQIRRACEKTVLSSRSENSWLLYPAAGGTAGLPIYRSNAQYKFKVPITETLRDEDYGLMRDWVTMTSKTVELYNVDEYLTPEVMIEYYDSSAEMQYPYILVQSVAYGKDENGEIKQILNAVTPSNQEYQKFYAEKDGIFDGLNCGDLIYVCGYNDTITSWKMEMSIDSVKNFDYNSPSVETGNQTCNLFEVYSVYNDSNMILQRGPVTEDSKRTHMQCNNFNKASDWGCYIYDATGREPVVRQWYNAHELDEAINSGNAEASVVYIRAHATVTKFVVAYKGLR